jgi:hypothetical protein
MIASALLLPLLLALRVRAVSAGLETLLFDAPAARAPDGSLAVSASVFTYRADARAGELESALARLVRPLTLLGVPHDAALATARARLRLFAAEPAADETVALAVAGCAGAPAPLGPTDATGVAVQTVALGACAAADVDAPLAGTVAGANASVPMAVYPAPDGGFGVISGARRAPPRPPGPPPTRARTQTSTTRSRSATSCTSCTCSRRRCSTRRARCRACPRSTRTCPHPWAARRSRS